MAVIARVGNSSANSGTVTTSSLSVSRPTGGTTVGNILIGQVGANTGTGITYNITGGTGGWTRVPGFTVQTASNVCLQDLYLRVVDGSEPTNFSATASTASRVVANIWCGSGVDTTTPFIDVKETNHGATTDTTMTFPTSTATVASVYALLFGRSRNATSVDTVNVQSTGFQIASDTSTTGTSFNQGFVLDEHSAFTGTPNFSVSPGNTTITPNNSNWVTTTLLLNPAATLPSVINYMAYRPPFLS